MATISNIVKGKTTTSAILDGINFNSIVHTGYGDALQWVKADNIWQTSANSATEVPYAVNAVDINWNGAQVGTKTINTTGELLAYIKELQDAVAVLSNNVGTLLGWTN